MLTRILICAAVVMSLGSLPLRSGQVEYRSQYLGEEHRQIKSLSAEDLEALSQGGGWGLAKAAELNGLPGPLHVLQMGDQIELSSEQEQAVQAIYDAMRSEAVEIGLQMIDLEAELDAAFANGNINQSSLRRLVTEISRLRGELRYIHLAAHLETPGVLSEQQVKQYYALRGYTEDPCARVPDGHDPDMWRRHNDCD